jgi:hypothetical protein
MLESVLSECSGNPSNLLSSICRNTATTLNHGPANHSISIGAPVEPLVKVSANGAIASKGCTHRSSPKLVICGISSAYMASSQRRAAWQCPHRSRRHTMR